MSHRLGISKAPSERRANARHACRIRCQMRKGRSWVPAVLVDMSLSGLAVVSPFQAEEGDPIWIRIDPPGKAQVALQGMVWRIRSAPAGGLSQTWALGMVIHKAGNDFLELVEFEARRSQRRPDSAPRRVPAASGSSRSLASVLAKRKVNRWFRVRVQHRERHCIRMLSVAGGCQVEASKRALQEVGQDWEVIEVRPT